MRTLCILAFSGLLALAGAACDGNGGKDGKDVPAVEDIVGELDDATPEDALPPEDVAGEAAPPATCPSKDTAPENSCMFSMLSCFDPAGPCTDVEGGFGWQWENGAKEVLEGTEFAYYGSDGTKCFTLTENRSGASVFKDAATGDTHTVASEEGTSCEQVTCHDGSTEILDSNDLDEAFFKDAGSQCFD